VTSNTTLLLRAIDDSQAYNPDWNNTGTNYINQFLGYKKRIYNISTNTSTSATARSRFLSIQTVLKGFFTGNVYFQKLVWGIFVEPWVGFCKI
jgi:hypothetical protein